MEFKVLVILSMAAVIISAGDIKKAPLLACDSPTIVKDQYIVMIKEELSDEEFEGHKNTVRNAMRLQGNNSKIMHEYHIGKGFRGYGIMADPKMLDALRGMDGVKHIEHDQEMHGVECKCQEEAEWGLFRTVEGDPTKEVQFYEYDDDDVASGLGVKAYIIDTGIYIEHQDFEGRAKFGFKSEEKWSSTDNNGHGTHVAGTVVGNEYGLAKKATAIAVKVLGDNGSGTTIGVIAGISWVAKQHKEKEGEKSVANMSLGGGASTVLDDAVNAAVEEGVFFAVAAGNENQDACKVSPARAKLAITVASINSVVSPIPIPGEEPKDPKFKRSSFSNYGDCVDIFAPGDAIESACAGYKDATCTFSGTSMASPHVAGVMVKIIAKEDPKFDHASMVERLTSSATKDQVEDDQGAPNLIVYHRDCIKPDGYMCPN